MAQPESYNSERSPDLSGRSRREKIMAEGPVNIEVVSAAPQAVSEEAKSPIPGMSQELFDTLSQRHSLETIQKQWARYKTHEEFLADAEKEAERIRTVLANAELKDEARQKAAGELLYGEGKELSEPQKRALMRMHAVGRYRPGARVFHYTFPEIREKVKIGSEKTEAGEEVFSTEERRKLFEAGLVGVAIPDWLEKMTEIHKRSQFQDALRDCERLERVNLEHYNEMTQDQKNAFDQLYKEAQDTMEHLIQEAFGEPILTFLFEEIKDKYRDALYPPRIPKTVGSAAYYGRQATAKTREEFIGEAHRLWGKDADTEDPKTSEMIRGKSHYEETFWQYGEEVLKRRFGLSTDQIREKRQKYEGIASYIASKTAVAIEKELKGYPLVPGNIDQGIGDKFLIDIKKEVKKEVDKRELDRREARKRATRKERLDYNDWREKFEFVWAETPEELRACVHDWLAWFEEQLPYEAEETVYNSILKGRDSAIASLERMLPELEIIADSPLAKELRATIDAHVAVIGAVRLLEVGGRDAFEHYLKFLTDFAKNFNEHHDAIYLGNAKSAIIQDFLSDGKISLGGPSNIEKPKDGDTRTHRELLEEAAKEYATNHELYIKESDFKEAEGTRYGWSDKIEELLLTDQRDRDNIASIADPAERAAAEARIDTRTKLFRSIKDRLDKKDKLFGLSDEERRQKIRERIRTEMDKRGGKAFGKQIDDITTQFTNKYREHFAKGFAHLNLSPADLQNAINTRMADPKVKQLLERQIQDAKDKALWKWVEDYNATKRSHSRNGWFPSSWDRVRLSIDRPAKLIDRALTKEQFKSFVEEVDDKYLNLTPEQIRDKIRSELTHKLGRGPSPGELEFEFEAVRFKQNERAEEAASAFNINRAYQKFLGVDARWGGLTVREINNEGKSELITTYQEVQEILEAKILLEEEQIKDRVRVWKEGYLNTHATITPNELQTRTQEMRNLFKRAYPTQSDAAIEGIVNAWREEFLSTNTTPEVLQQKTDEIRTQFRKDYPNEPDAEIDRLVNEWLNGFDAEATSRGLTQDEKDAKILEQERKFRRNATFAATLGLREIGIANALPIWNYFYYGDVSQIEAFAPLVGYTADEKDKLTEILDRGRREMEAVWTFVARKHMDKYYGGFLVVHDDKDLVVEDESGKLKKFHEEADVRGRVINEAGELTHRDLFEARFMISTSGGVKVPNLISKLADLGVYDFLWEMGCLDFREFQGFIKRRDEAELADQTFFNTRKWADPVSWVKRFRGASNARTFLVGGEIQGQGKIPGVLNEPFNGLWRFRDEFLQFSEWISINLRSITEGKGELPKFNSKEELITILNSETVKKQINTNTPEKVKQFRSWVLELLSYEDVGDYLKTVHKDKMVPVGAEILKFLTSYMDSRDYVRNRAGFATKNWQWDNELFLRAFFGETANMQPVKVKKGDLRSVKDGVPEYYPMDGDYKNYDKDYPGQYPELSKTEGGMIGGDHLAYAPEGRSVVAVNIFRTILSSSSYHTLDKADVRTFEGMAWRQKAAMDAKRAEIVAQGLSQTELDKIDRREAQLRLIHTSDAKIAEERKKLEKLYYEKRLKKKFVGEWSTRLLDAA